MKRHEELNIVLALVILFFCMILLIACEKNENAYEEFLIKEGNHYCSGARSPFSTTDESYSFYFGSDCLYDEGLITPGWNKLIGFSQPFPEKNSIRIGWRCVDNMAIALCAYAHVDGSDHMVTPLDTIMPNEIAECRISLYNDKYVAIVNGRMAEFHQPRSASIAVKSYPYFGGRSTAPHDMHIYIKPLN